MSGEPKHAGLFEKMSDRIGGLNWSDFLSKTNQPVHWGKVFGEDNCIFDLDAFDKILNKASLKSEDLEFFKSGKWLDGNSIKSLKDYQSAFNISDLDKAGIFSLLEDGYSLRLNEAQRFSDDLALFLKKAAAGTVSRLSLNIYFTLKGNSCLLPHSDDQSIFIIQLSGEKNWYLGEVSDQFEKEPPHMVLKAGDVLFIPNGVRHAASCGASHSMHVTLAFNPRSFNEYIQHCLSGEKLKFLLNQKISGNFEQRQKQLGILAAQIASEISDLEDFESYLQKQPFAGSGESIRKKFSI